MNGRVGKAMGAVALAAATVLMAPMAAQAGLDNTCRPLIGVDTQVTPPAITTPSAWTTVDANSASFKSRNVVDSCSVKVVVSVAKGKPTSGTLTVAGPLAQDECSLYGYLSSIDSKLVMNKYAEAKTVATDMLTKVDALAGTGKLDDPGYGAIRQWASAVQVCVLALP